MENKMKIILVFGILCYTGMNASNAQWIFGSGGDDESTTTESGENILVDRFVSVSDGYVDPNDGGSENDNPNSDVESSTIQPKTVVDSAHPMPYDSNVDQTRISAERLPEPDYRAVNMREHIPSTSCHSGQYQCQKTNPQQQQVRCIPQEWRCNGLRDCENNDDESSCSPNQLTRGRTQAKCTQDQYQCHGSGINGVPPHCIDRQSVCDGTYQCSYGDDEANCVDRRDDPRDTRDQRRNENNPDINPQNNIYRSPDPREIYRPQNPPNPERKSDEYVQRLEWRDRCFRSCLKY